MFEELKLKSCYRSKKDDLTNDFFVPLLTRTRVYDRGTGYFSLSALYELANGIIPYIRSGGIIRIITSPELTQEDLVAISKGYIDANEKAKDIIIEEIEKEIDNSWSVNLDLITNLIAANKLIIKIAYQTEDGLVVSICVYDTYFQKLLQLIEPLNIKKILVVDSEKG